MDKISIFSDTIKLQDRTNSDTAGSSGETINTKYQDTIFRDLFNGDKKMLLHLYKILHVNDSDIDLISEDDLKLITLQNVITNKIRNDVAFRVGNTIMILIEHQSTINWNMPIRLLLYYVMEIIQELPDGINTLYKRMQLELPDVEFYVVYSGTEKWSVKQLRLSDAFPKRIKPQIDLIVKVIQEKDCKSGILKDYLGFVHLIKSYREVYEKTDDGIRTAVLHAINDYVSGKVKASQDFVNYLT